MTTSSDQRARPRKHDPAMLHPGWRAAMALVGLVMVAAGATAVFKTKVESGPTALIAIGAILLLVSAGGRAVTHFKFGETEINTAEGREEVERALEQEEPAQALASVQTAAAYDPAILTDPEIANLTREAYERLIFDVIRRTGRTGLLVTTAPRGPFDLEVSTDNTKAAIEVRFTRNPPGHTVVRDLAGRMVNREWGYSGLVLVTPVLPTARLVPELVEEFRQMTGKDLKIVQWAANVDDLPLGAAIQELLGE